MTKYKCPKCHEITETEKEVVIAFCPACMTIMKSNRGEMKKKRENES